jgi:hypothetical protein
MTDKAKSAAQHWQITGSMPPVDRPGYSRNWRENVTAHVVAATAERAIELLKLRRPGITIFSVNNRGAIDFIDDTESA